MSRPRVLFLTTSYPSEDAPATGVFVREHARAVSPHAEVAVLHLDRRHGVPRPLSVRREEDEDFPTWRVRYPYRPTVISAAAHVAAGLAGYRAVRRSGFEPDLIHAHFFLAAIPGALLSALHRKPLVETEQWTIFLPEDPNRLTPLLRWSARVSLRRARTVMPVSESLAAAMRSAGIRGPFRVVPNAVDTSLFRTSARAPSSSARLVTVGLLTEQKGIDVLLEALARLDRDDVRLDVVGDGPRRSDYEARSRELRLDGVVRFHGLLPKERVAELLGEADLFVLASRFDNNPCVLVEAQAAGLPIVSTRVGGIPEIVGDNGILVRPDDPAALATGIEEAIATLNRVDRQSISRRASDRYSLEAVGAVLAEVYRQAADAT